MIAYTNLPSIRRREYSKIFTGSNTEGGYENIYLSFSSATREFVFEPSKINFFHYSKFAPRITIHDADLISEGATGGTSPYRADKIFKMQANYENYVSWGNSQDVQQGTWLCTWLAKRVQEAGRDNTIQTDLIAIQSGKGGGDGTQVPPGIGGGIAGVDGGGGGGGIIVGGGGGGGSDIPIPEIRGPLPPTVINFQWMDRFYDPGKITFQDALTAVIETYTESDTALYDRVSEMTFDPGVLYLYHHVGDTENDVVVDSLNNGYKEELLRLNIKDWTADESSFGNNGELNIPEAISREKINEIASTVLELSSTVDANYRIPYSDSYNTPDKFTINCWVKSDDWAHIKGNAIFGNYFRGGWGLMAETIDFNPLMGIFETSRGHLLMGNKSGQIYQDKLITSPISSENVTLSGILISPDYYTYTITNGTTKMLYKIDYDGDIVDTFTFPTSSSLTDLTMDSLGNVYVMDSTGFFGPSANVWKFDSFTMDLVSRTSVVSTAYDFGIGPWQIEFDSQDTLVTHKGHQMVVDHQDIVWWIQEPNPDLYRLVKSVGVTNTPMQSSDVGVFYNTTSMAVDAEGYLWFLQNATDFKKIDGFSFDIPKISVEGQIGVSSVSANREIAFTKEYVNGQYIDYGWILQEADQLLYKFNPHSGELVASETLVNKLNFNKYAVINKEDISFAAKGDFMGTQWSYKYFGGQSLNTPGIYFYLTTKDPTGAIVKTKLKYDTADLTNKEWHMLTLTFNNLTGTIKIYNNSVLVDTTSVAPGSTLYFKYKNLLFFGSNSGRFTSLNEELQTDQLHFDGSIAEPSIYHRDLTQDDIAHLYRQKIPARPVKWNSPIGKQVFIEEIERFFKHKLPGSKSNFYNISLTNFGISDTNLKALIEDTIRKTVKKVAPVNTELLKINWS